MRSHGDDPAQELAGVWAWRHRAACRNVDLLTFFGPDDEGVSERALRERRAKAICASCPVIGPCATYALRNREPYGIWGGLTERERRRLWPAPEAARGTA